MADSDCPVRSYMDGEGTKWRHGSPPNYDLVNEKYLKERSRIHKVGSMEKFVENFVKTWEMESEHKLRADDWETTDKESFVISTNGGRKYSIEEYIQRGSYNVLMETCPLYDSCAETHESSHDLFMNTLMGGFAWELLELLSGPPIVAFTWRHWGTWQGKFKENQPTQETIELFGSAVIRLSDKLKVQSIEIFYDPNPMMAKLTKFNLFKC